jgi:hypothetical protein
MAVRVFKLVNGDDIVGDVQQVSTPETVTIKNAAKFVFTQQGIGMMPFFPFSKSDTVSIKTTHVLCDGDVDEDVYNAWSAQFGSGIVLGGSGDMESISKTLKLNPKK